MPRCFAVFIPFLFGFCASAEPLVLEIYNAASPRPAAQCRAAGFNTLVVSRRDQLDLCQRLGFRGVFSGLPHSPASFDPGAVREKVDSVKGHPALAGYILIDEPDLRPWEAKPSFVARMAEVVKEADPQHPVMATFAGFLGARSLVAYLDAVDIIRLDSYPFFNRRPLTWAMEVLDACRAATGDRKPIWLIQQAWSDSPRFPPPADDLCLTYLALIHGVQGIGHYAYRFGDRGKSQTLPEHEPEFWTHLQAATAHLAAIHELSDPPANARLFCGSLSGSIDWALRQRNGELLLFLCNPTSIEDHAVLEGIDSDARLASFVLGRPLEDHAAAGTLVRMRPRETLLFRVAGGCPSRLSESVLPLTVELHHLGENANAYERVLIRNAGKSLEACKLIVTDQESGFKAETITDVPSGMAAERVVYVEEPVTQRLERGVAVSLEVLDQNDAPLVRTTYTRTATIVQGNNCRGMAEVRADPPLERGREYELTTEIVLPGGDDIPSVTVQYHAPGLAEALEKTVSLQGNRASARFAVTIPEFLCAERYESLVRWTVPGVSGSGDLWIPLSLSVRPVVDVEDAGSVRFLEAGREEILPFHFTPSRHLDVSGCHLVPPEGWTVTSDAVSTPVTAEGGRSMVSFAVRPPKGEFRRGSGSLAFHLAKERNFGIPIDFSVPLKAFPARDDADFFNPLAWDKARGHRLGKGEAGDLEAQLKILWNSRCLALRCAVTDREHFINAGEGGVWRGDSLQVSVLVTPRLYRTPEMGDPGFANFGFAYDSEKNETLVDLGFVGKGIDGEVARSSLQTMGKRENGVTTYIIVIPWDAIGANIADAQKAARFSLLINDYDRPDQSDRHWLEFGGGIVRGTDPVQFADLLLGS